MTTCRSLVQVQYRPPRKPLTTTVRGFFVEISTFWMNRFPADFSLIFFAIINKKGQKTVFLKNFCTKNVLI